MIKVIILVGPRNDEVYKYLANNDSKSFYKLSSKTKSQLEVNYELATQITSKSNVYITSSRLLENKIKSFIDISSDNLILEPESKGTLLAIGYSLIKINSLTDTYVIMHADQYYSKDLVAQIKELSSTIKSGELFSIGIPTTELRPNYGYLETGYNSRYVLRFHKSLIANQKVSENKFYTNIGIHIFKGDLIKLLDSISVDIWALRNNYENDLLTPEKIYSNALTNQFESTVLDSIRNYYCFPILGKWNSFSSFKQLFDFHKKDSEGNVLFSQCITDNITNSIIYLDKTKYLNEVLDNKVIIEKIDELIIKDI